MCRQLILSLLLMLSVFGCASNPKSALSEKGAPDKHNTLVLSCSIMASDFSGLKDINLTKAAFIRGLKHQPGGAVKIATIEPYEFWVMAHGLILDNPSRILNYQVAIKDRRTNQFMHALSDTSLDIAIPPKSARISLVDTTQILCWKRVSYFLNASNIDQEAIEKACTQFPVENTQCQEYAESIIG